MRLSLAGPCGEGPCVKQLHGYNDGCTHSGKAFSLAAIHQIVAASSTRSQWLTFRVLSLRTPSLFLIQRSWVQILRPQKFVQVKNTSEKIKFSNCVSSSFLQFKAVPSFLHYPPFKSLLFPPVLDAVTS